MTKPTDIDDEDLSRLLEIAHNLSTEDRKKMTLSSIKATAAELGLDISSDKIDKAFLILKQEKALEIEQNQRQKIKLIVGAIAMLVLVSGLAFYYFSNRVPEFKGSVNVTLTSRIVDTKAADILKTYKIFEQSTATLLIEIQEIDKRNKVHYEIYDSNNQLFLKKHVATDRIYKPDIYVPVPLTLPIGVGLGTWRIDVYVDEKKQQTHSFEVNWGSVDVTLTDALDNNSYMKAPLRKVENFKKSEHTYAICHVFWSIIDKKRGGNTLDMKWISPDGKLNEESKIAIKPTNDKAYYWAKAGITLKDKPLGKWKVELWYGDTQISTHDFTLAD